MKIKGEFVFPIRHCRIQLLDVCVIMVESPIPSQYIKDNSTNNPKFYSFLPVTKSAKIYGIFGGTSQFSRKLKILYISNEKPQKWCALFFRRLMAGAVYRILVYECTTSVSNDAKTRYVLLREKMVLATANYVSYLVFTLDNFSTSSSFSSPGFISSIKRSPSSITFLYTGSYFSRSSFKLSPSISWIFTVS